MTGEELTGVDDTMKEGRPTTVVVGPHVYEIVFSDEEINRIGNDSRVEFLMGHHSARQSKIYIRDTGLSVTQERDTLLHEILHAVWSMVGLDEMSDLSEEQIINAIAPSLLAALTGSPEVTLWLFGRD